MRPPLCPIGLSEGGEEEMEMMIVVEKEYIQKVRGGGVVEEMERTRRSAVENDEIGIRI